MIQKDFSSIKQDCHSRNQPSVSRFLWEERVGRAPGAQVTLEAQGHQETLNTPVGKEKQKEKKCLGKMSICIVKIISGILKSNLKCYEYTLLNNRKYIFLKHSMMTDQYKLI